MGDRPIIKTELIDVLNDSPLCGEHYNRNLSAQTNRQKATAAAAKALEGDDALPEGHASVALVALWFDWEWTRAQVEFERALKLNPGYAAAHQWYCWYLAAMGKFEQAEAE